MELKNQFIGKKIILREFEEADAPAIYEALQDFEIHKNLRQLPNPYKPEDAQTYILSSQKERESGEKFNFAIIDSEKNKLAGSISVINHKEITAEIGYWIGEQFRGKGFTSEAIGVLLKEIFNNYFVESIIANVFEDNIASIKLLQKNKFTQNENYKGSSCNSYKETKVLQFELKRKDF